MEPWGIVFPNHYHAPPSYSHVPDTYSMEQFLAAVGEIEWWRGCVEDVIREVQVLIPCYA